MASLADAIQQDRGMFFDPELSLAEEFSYFPSGGAEIELAAPVIWRGPLQMHGDDGIFWRIELEVLLSDADVDAPGPEDSIVISGVAFEFEKILEQSTAVGMALAQFVRDETDYEKAAGAYRKLRR